MNQDGQDPPVLGPRPVGLRPKFSVITGGAGTKSDRPEPPALARSSLSPEGRQRLLRALRMLGGERAFLFVWDEQEFTLSEACATDELGNEPRDRNVMWSLLDRITSQRAPLVMAGTDDQPTDAMLSGITAPLRMAIAVPLLAGENLKGVACFDKRIHKGQYVVSDAHAAASVLSALGIEASQLATLQSSSGIPTEPARVEHLLARLVATMCPSVDDAAQHRVHVTLAEPRPHEVCFWQRSERGDGTQRLVTARLTVAQGSDGDSLVASLLASMRVLSLLVEANLEDQLSGMAFEIERVKKDGFELHVGAVEWTPGSATVSTWHAGELGLFAVGPTGAARALDAATKPLARSVRSVQRGTHRLEAGERVLCLHRDGLFVAQGASKVDAWLSGGRAEGPDALRHALAAGAGPTASIFWIEP